MKHLDEILNKLEEVKTLVQGADKAPEPKIFYIRNIYNRYTADPSDVVAWVFGRRLYPLESVRLAECPEGSVVINREIAMNAWKRCAKNYNNYDEMMNNFMEQLFK